MFGNELHMNTGQDISLTLSITIFNVIIYDEVKPIFKPDNFEINFKVTDLNNDMRINGKNDNERIALVGEQVVNCVKNC